jgi:hypothetical protein
MSLVGQIFHHEVFVELKKEIDSGLRRPFSGDLLVFGSSVIHYNYIGERRPSDLDLVAKVDTWRDLLASGVFELSASSSGCGDALTTQIMGVKVEVFGCWPHISSKSLWVNASRFDTRGLIGSVYNLCLYKYYVVAGRPNKTEPLGEENVKHLVDLIYILEIHPGLFSVMPPNAMSVMVSQARLNGVEVKWAGV